MRFLFLRGKCFELCRSFCAGKKAQTLKLNILQFFYFGLLSHGHVLYKENVNTKERNSAN